METLKFDPQVIWQRMLEDVTFRAETPEGAPRQMFQEMIGQLPEIIGDQMDAPVSPTSVIQAKLRVLRHFVTSDFMARVIRSFPDDYPGFQIFNREAMATMMSGMMPTLLEMTEVIAGDVPGFLASQDVSDEIFLGHERGMGLDAASMRAYRDGSLTIAGLLMLQPKVILSSSKNK